MGRLAALLLIVATFVVVDRAWAAEPPGADGQRLSPIRANPDDADKKMIRDRFGGKPDAIVDKYALPGESKVTGQDGNADLIGLYDITFFHWTENNKHRYGITWSETTNGFGRYCADTNAGIQVEVTVWIDRDKKREKQLAWGLQSRLGRESGKGTDKDHSLVQKESRDVPDFSERLIDVEFRVLPGGAKWPRR